MLLSMAATEAAVRRDRAERNARSITLTIPTLIMLILIAMGIGGWVFIAQYEPLTQGAMGGVSGEARRIETLGDPEQLVLLNHTDHGGFVASFTIRNDGPVDVKVERLLYDRPLDSGDGPFYPVEVLVHPGERFVGARNLPYEEWAEFGAFSLESGGERRVAVRYAFGDCSLGRGETVWTSSIPVEFSVFGLERHTDYQLPYTLAMKSEPGGGCP